MAPKTLPNNGAAWSALTRLRIAVITTLLLLGTIRTIGAQSTEAPNDVAVRIGPLALAPVVSLYDAGRDDNVYNRSVGFNPQGDLTATTRLTVDEWLRMSRARMYGRTQLDYHYFKELAALRVLDTAATARVDFLLNRLTPFVEGGFTDASFQQNLEIDAIARRQDTALVTGAEMRLSARFRAGAYLRRRDLEYDEDSFFLGSDLGEELNHTSSSEGVQVKYVATPYTTFAVAVERVRDRFGDDSDRNSDSIVVLPSVEFNPRAIVERQGRDRVPFPGVPLARGARFHRSGRARRLELRSARKYPLHAGSAARPGIFIHCAQLRRDGWDAVTLLIVFGNPGRSPAA